MQRIDENTYIDDTLVTCAEYQLFVDEMHEQRNYYQPDHWSSYQFLKEQAHQPILGVRHSDAVKFCGWLTQRQSAEWRYRLPTAVEAIEFPFKLKLNLSSLGYWIMGADKQSRFAWIGSVPENPRGSTFSVDRAIDLARAVTRRASDPRGVYGFDRTLKRARAREYTHPLDFDNARSNAIKIDIIRVLVPELVRVLHRNLPRSVELPLTRAIELASALSDDPGRDTALDLYIDLYTLGERIAGRSPAFEGIRLVKERIK